MSDASTAPLWFKQLEALRVDISSKDWAVLQQHAKTLVKSLHAEAPTVKPPIETIVLTLMQGDPVDIETEMKIKTLYARAQELAAKELNTTEFDRVIREEELSEELDKIYNNIHRSWRKVWNYWRGEGAGDYIRWSELKGEIEQTPLTRVGRLRLLAWHGAIGKRIMPSFLEMMLQLWPIAALWVAKKLGTIMVTQTVAKGLEARKTRKKLQGLSSALKDSKLTGLSSLKKSDGR